MLENKIQHIMHLDEHADTSGEYVIRSVYFDDYNRSCFYENEYGIDPREKFRIRIYNYSDNVISLEKKIKKQGMTGKKSCRLEKDLCMKMIKGDSLYCYLGVDPLLDEWIIARENRILCPVMLGEYVRKPYVYPLGNVRITFDMNISASDEPQALFDPQAFKISLLPTGYHILEVKYDDYLPDIIYRLLDLGHFQQTTFSKFYLGCKAIGGRLNEFY